MRFQPFQLTQPAAICLFVLSLSGCATTNVSAYIERGFELRQYRSFAWGPADTSTTGDPRLDNNRFFDERVRAQVERGLTSRGFEKTSSAASHLLVHYHISVTQKLDTRRLDPSYSYSEDGNRQRDAYDAGTLFVDLVDPRTQRLVWRGWAEGSLDGVIDDQDWLDARIDDAVTRILRQLPPAL